MKIILEAESPEEVQSMKCEKISYQGVTDYYLYARWTEGNIVQKSDSRSGGDVWHLVEKLYGALIYLKAMCERSIK